MLRDRRVQRSERPRIINGSGLKAKRLRRRQSSAHDSDFTRGSWNRIPFMTDDRRVREIGEKLETGQI